MDLLPELKTWWDPLLEQADMICAGIDQPVLLDVGDERIVIDFATREVRRPLEDEDPRYQFAIDRELVDHLVREHVEDWVNELFLSMRFRARRRGPYNDYVYTWFKCLNEERLQYAEGFYAEHGPTQGTFEFAGYDIQRRCPAHEGRPHPVRLRGGRGHDLRPARLAMGAGDRDVHHLRRAPAVRAADRRADATTGTRPDRPAEGEPAAAAGQA